MLYRFKFLNMINTFLANCRVEDNLRSDGFDCTRCASMRVQVGKSLIFFFNLKITNKEYVH